MTEQDLIIQELRRENSELKNRIAELTNPKKIFQVRKCGDGNYFCDGLCTICDRKGLQ